MASEFAKKRQFFLDRILSFYVGVFSVAAWTCWYEIFANHEGGEDPKLRLLFFVGMLLAAEVALTMWYLRHQQWFAEAAAHADATSKPSRNISDPEMQAMLVEKSYQNLSDAIGYILATAWTKVFDLKPAHAGIAALEISLIVLAAFFVLNLAEIAYVGRQQLAMTMELIGQFMVGGFAWSIATPASQFFKHAAGQPVDEPSHGALFILAFMAGAVVSIGVVQLRQSKRLPQLAWQCLGCFASNADIQEDSDAEWPSSEDSSTEQPSKKYELPTFCTRSLAVYQSACFFAAATLVKERVLADTEDWKHLQTMTVVGAACLGTAFVLERLGAAVIAAVAKSSKMVTYVRELISLLTRLCSWLFAGVWVAWGKTLLCQSCRGFRIKMVISALTSQAVSLMLEEYRMSQLRRLSEKRMAGLMTLPQDDSKADNALDTASDNDSGPRRGSSTSDEDGSEVGVDSLTRESRVDGDDGGDA